MCALNIFISKCILYAADKSTDLSDKEALHIFSYASRMANNLSHTIGIDQYHHSYRTCDVEYFTIQHHCARTRWKTSFRSTFMSLSFSLFSILCAAYIYWNDRNEPYNMNIVARISLCLVDTGCRCYSYTFVADIFSVFMILLFVDVVL